MTNFFILLFASLQAVTLANPVPQTSNDFSVAESKPDCHLESSINTFSNQDDIPSLDIIARATSTCPVTGFKSSPGITHQRFPDGQSGAKQPWTTNKDGPSQTTNSGKNSCSKTSERDKLVSCAGPEVLNETGDIIKVVACVFGESHFLTKDLSDIDFQLCAQGQDPQSRYDILGQN